MSARRVVVAVVSMALASACYGGPNDATDHCKIACADSCPDGLTCEAATGFCVGAGATCVPPALSYVDVHSGSRHSCALTGDGHIYCWGDNADGQLGIQGITQTGTPLEVGDDATNWTALSVGAEHTCGIHDGVAVCWGQNQVGQAAAASGGIIATPTTVPVVAGGSPFTAISAGTHHTCALAGGDAWCWGLPGAAGLSAPAVVATRVPPPTTKPTAKWSVISAGASTTCAIDRDGGISCWGDDGAGQAGSPGPDDGQPLPPTEVVLPAQRSAIRITTGNQSTCAVLSTSGVTASSGELWCWGHNLNGYLDPAANNLGKTIGPTQVGSDADWTSVAVNDSVICGVRNVQAYCWGNSNYGGLGDGYWQESGPVPISMARMISGAYTVTLSVQPPNDPDVRDELGCLRYGNEIECWGDQRDGAVGIGPPSMTAIPREVPAPIGLTWKQIWAGDQHNCALASDGSLWCWGADYFGQVRGMIGLGATQPCIAMKDCDEPSPVAGPILGTSPNLPTGTVLGDDYSCVLQGSGIWCWGDYSMGDLGINGAHSYNPVAVTPSSSQGWAAITGGPEGTCAVDVADPTELACWGEFNTNTRTSSATPNPLGHTLSPSASVSLGTKASCALDGTDRFCWGDNTGGELGDGGMSDETAPKMISSGISQLAFGGEHGCEIGADGALRCWGVGTFGEAGVVDATQSNLSPIAINDTFGQPLTGCTAVAASAYNSCALCAQGGSAVEPYCWGRNDMDQLGRAANVTAPTSAATPVDAPMDKMWTQIAVGLYHACALDDAGELFCWGYGAHGVLGDGSRSRNLPTRIAEPAN